MSDIQTLLLCQNCNTFSRTLSSVNRVLNYVSIDIRPKPVAQVVFEKYWERWSHV